jgi:hypothetical protein
MYTFYYLPPIIRAVSNLCQSVAKVCLTGRTAAIAVCESSIMKAILTTLCSIAAINFIGTDLRADISQVEIHCVPKKVDTNGNQPSRAGHVTRTKEHWSYDVTVENKTFQDLSGLEMKYVIFFNKEKLAARDAAASRRQNGSLSIGSLKPHEKKVFTTDSVELDSSRLASDYYYADGGRQKAQDTLGGLWVRVYQNGQQLAEYANPSTLTKERWE